MQDSEIRNLGALLERIREASEDSSEVSLEEILEAVGQRALGPFLLLAGLMVLAPIVGDIPGVPTVTAIFILLIAGQLLFGRDRLWLPKWLLSRSIARKKIEKMLDWFTRPAKFIDRFLAPRLTSLTQGLGTIVVAVVCILIALAMPVMEVVPFSANLGGAALTAFGLSLIARDGLLALLAFACTTGTFVLILYLM